jgi:hypothetical protein
MHNKMFTSQSYGKADPIYGLIVGDIHIIAFDSVISVMMQLLNGQKVESSLAVCSYSLPAVLTTLLSHE